MLPYATSTSVFSDAIVSGHRIYVWESKLNEMCAFDLSGTKRTVAVTLRDGAEFSTGMSFTDSGYLIFRNVS